MRLPGDNEYKNSRLSAKYIILGVTLCLLLVIVVMTLNHKENKGKKAETKENPVLALEHEESTVPQTQAATNMQPFQDSYAQQVVDITGAADIIMADATDAADMTGMSDMADTPGSAEMTQAGENGFEMPDTTAGSTDRQNVAESMSSEKVTESMVAEKPVAEGTENKTAEGKATESKNTGSKNTGSATAAGSVTSEEKSEPVIMKFNGGKSLKDVERLYEEGKLVASDLDFWDMYPQIEQEVIRVTDDTISESKDTEKSESDEEKETDDTQQAQDETHTDRYSRFEEAAKKEQESDPSRDGKHTLVKGRDGSEEWVLINPYLEQNTYDFSNLSWKNKKMVYNEDGRQTSYVGVDLSKHNNTVDFVSMKASGVDFVMLRVGSRGYGSGQIMPDEKFVEYITQATQAGLQIGVYFYSQAITKDEAIEEANFVIQNLANYTLTYPVAFDMEYANNDSARIDVLTREEKTTIAKTFLKTIKEAGYKPMIYGTKEWLLKEIDLTKLTEYDIWLSQQENEPDYPYQFQMWQYSLSGTVSGVTGTVDMNISFVDYSEK